MKRVRSKAKISAKRQERENKKKEKEKNSPLPPLTRWISLIVDAMAREKKIDDQQPYLLRYASCLPCGCTKGTALRITIVGLLAAVMMALTVVVLCGVGIVVALLQWKHENCIFFEIFSRLCTHTCTFEGTRFSFRNKYLLYA